MRLHLIPNSHIDPVWLWDQYEGIDEVLNTFRSACDRLDEYPDLTFSASSLRFYAWLMEYDSVLFERVKAFVKSGRWEVVGDWWIEADTNLPSGKSLQMQSVVSRAFATKHFGGTSSVAFLPDTFGHPADLPQILSESGFKYLIFCRPDADEKDDLPGDLFYWTYRGHKILAYRLRHHYFQEDTRDEERLARVNDPEYSAHPVNAFFFGMGDHGGGPTIEEIKFFRHFISEQPEGEVHFSNCEKFFADAVRLRDTPDNPIPHYSGDLHMHAVGCYSVVRDIKQLMRSGERALAQAERAARMADRSYSIDYQWRTLLFNQFHDILPGSMSPDAGDHARQELGSVIKDARDLTYISLKRQSLAHSPSVREGEFRVFNTLPFPITAPISIESFLYFTEGAAFCDATGRELQIQEVLPDVRCGSRRWVFVDTIPASGFNSYHFDSCTVNSRPSADSSHFVHKGDVIATNEAPFAPDFELKLLVSKDDSDTWSHGVDRFTGEACQFTLVEESSSHGTVVDSVFQRMVHHNSQADIVFSRYPALDGVFLDIRVRWAEERSILKLEIKRRGASFERIRMQGGVGAIDRIADGRELPMHQWIHVPGSGGFNLIQEGVFACDAKDNKLRLTLVRSSLYGYDKKTKLWPHDPERHTDFGEHFFRLWISEAQSDPGDGDGEQPSRMMTGYLADEDGPNEDQLDQAADAFLERIVVIRETP